MLYNQNGREVCSTSQLPYWFSSVFCQSESWEIHPTGLMWVLEMKNYMLLSCFFKINLLSHLPVSPVCSSPASQQTVTRHLPLAHILLGTSACLFWQDRICSEFTYRCVPCIFTSINTLLLIHTPYSSNTSSPTGWEVENRDWGPTSPLLRPPPHGDHPCSCTAADPLNFSPTQPECV